MIIHVLSYNVKLLVLDRLEKNSEYGVPVYGVGDIL